MTAIFNQTLMAMMFYDAAEAKGIEVQIVPAPRQYSVSCGLACRFPDEKEGEIRKMCEDRKIQVAAFHNDAER